MAPATGWLSMSRTCPDSDAGRIRLGRERCDERERNERRKNHRSPIGALSRIRRAAAPANAVLGSSRVTHRISRKFSTGIRNRLFAVGDGDIDVEALARIQSFSTTSTCVPADEPAETVAAVRIARPLRYLRRRRDANGCPGNGSTRSVAHLTGQCSHAIHPFNPRRIAGSAANPARTNAFMPTTTRERPRA